MNTQLKKAVGYVRCSTEDQEDSPDQQKAEILAFAAKKHYHIVDWFVDFGRSGTTFDQRPEFQRLLRLVEAGANFEVVVCYDMSRWGRAINVAENGYWSYHFRRLGVDVVLVKTSVDPQSSFAEVVSALESYQAADYVKNLSEVTLRGALKNGIYSNGGSAPYGYEREAVNLKTGTTRILQRGEASIPSQEKVRWTRGQASEVRVVKRIFKERLGGRSLIQIAQGLNADGIDSPTVGRRRSRDGRWSAATVKSILENPAYRGARRYNRFSFSKIRAQKKGLLSRTLQARPHWLNDPSEWVIVDDAHEALVTSEVWQKVQPSAASSRKRSFRRQSRYLLSGLIYCEQCGYAMQGYSSRRSGYQYYKYVDGGWQNKRVCQPFSIPQARIESCVGEAAISMSADPLIRDRVREIVAKSMEEPGHLVAAELHQLTMAIAENEVRKQRLVKAVEVGGDVSALVERIKELEASIGAAELRLRSLQSQTSRFQSVDAGRLVDRFYSTFADRFDRADTAGKKKLIGKCVAKVLVDPDVRRAKVYMKRIPIEAVTGEIATKSKTPLTDVASGACSGGGIRTHDLRIMIPTL